MVRKIIITLVTVLILVGGFALSGKLADSKKPPEKKKEKHITTVFTTTVANGDVPIRLTATGKLTAKNRIELYAEVQGIMLDSDGNFKAGERFDKGARLVQIDGEVFRASLKAQKSSLQNLITAALADLKLDYPNSFAKWEAYSRNFNVNKPVVELPEPADDKERMFITGRNIYSTYYNVKNAELTLAKYDIYAPYDGVLTEALVNTGTLIRPGQKLGSFIDPSVYEMETPVPVSMLEFMKVGESVKLTSTHSTEKWKGRVSRINSMVNAGTQTVNIYIEVSGNGLEEGMFLEAQIDATHIQNAFEIDRSVLFDDGQVYVANDSLLVQKEVQPQYYNEKTVVVSGLADGDQVLTKMPPGAYPGMRITIFGN
ncbi:MAG: HlyD family efflux transporter periplasmic adaptor subunit [Flavobacteriales bacterium]|nr:HlyD family efflux transporter periplasmic adaptor subunit [Flavobacteriales bacterium]